jgi:hypothetical protein
MAGGVALCYWTARSRGITVVHLLEDCVLTRYMPPALRPVQVDPSAHAAKRACLP